MTLGAFSAVALLALVWADGVGAEPVALRYQREAGAEGCPDEAWIRRAVASRLGADPFEPAAPVKLSARLFGAAPGLRAVLEVQRPHQPVARRELSSAVGDCQELSGALELAIAIAIDPQRWSRGISHSTARPRIDLFGRGLGSHGLSPLPVPGAALELSLQWPRFRLGLEGRVDLRGRALLDGGRISSSVLLATLLPCAELGRLGLCGAFTAGGIQVTGEWPGNAVRQSGPLLLAGARVDWTVRLTDRVRFRPSASLQAVLTRTTVCSGPVQVWVTPPFAATLAIGFGGPLF